MALVYNQLNKSIADITGPSGWYGVRAAGRTIPVYVDQDYDGGGWVCVLANRGSTGGMNNLNYQQAVNECHFRTEPSTNNSSNTRLDGPKNGTTTLSDVNIWVGLKFWEALAGRATAGKVTVVQFVASTNGTPLSGTHTKRWRWQFDNFNTSTWAFQNVTSVGGEGGTTDSPGMYNYHAVNGYSLTTHDNDQDLNAGNCATYYNNNPFWYGSCWSGNYFAGGSYADRPYWVGSSADNHQYGAVYIK